MCPVLKLKTHSAEGNAIACHAPSQGRNCTAEKAKEESNLPTDLILVVACCQAL